MQPFESFLSRFNVYVPACPQPLAEQALLDSAIEFCEETNVVQSVSTPVDVVAGTATYTVPLGTDLDVCRILFVWFDDKQLTLSPRQSVNTPLAFNSVAGDKTTPQGTPTVAFVNASNTVTIYPTPDKSLTNGLTISAATRPTRSATQLSDQLYIEWPEAIVAGAVKRVAAIPDQPFTSLTVAAQAQAVFNYYISRARVENSRGRVRGDQRVQPRPFA